MTVRTQERGVEALIGALDGAVEAADDAECCRRVKRVLVEAMAGAGGFLPSPLLATAQDRYARRLLHRDPAGRYTVVIMVWGPGQGTALHDHAGIWCVECVYQGHIRVTSYAVRGGDPETGVVEFSEETSVVAGVGEAGALIPPFEYHRIENAAQPVAVTLHVYGGEMHHCHVFEPRGDGSYQRQFRSLQYTA